MIIGKNTRMMLGTISKTRSEIGFLRRNEGLSELIMCDRCKDKYYTDSRSDKGAYCEMRIIYTGGNTTMHLCKSCFRLFNTDFMSVCTGREFDETFGKDIPKAFDEEERKEKMGKDDLYKYNICGECRRFRTTVECEGYCLADDEDDETRGTRSAFEEACKYFEKANDVM